MNPQILWIGAAVFLLCLAFHILLWRACRPADDMRALFIIFIVSPLILALLYILTQTSGGRLSLETVSDLSAIYLLHAALSSAYIQTYPAAQAVSPSLEILMLIGRSEPSGMTSEEITKHFNPQKLVEARFDDLVNTKLVREEEGTLSLAPAGRRLIRFFVMYRRILGLEFKGG